MAAFIPKYRRFIYKHPGFTLIELLVVISIIGLLASVILVALNNTRIKGRDVKRRADMRQLSTALQMYYSDKGYYPNAAWPDNTSLNTSWQDGTSPLAQALSPYLKKLPMDTNNNDVTCFGLGAHFYTYQVLDSGQGYGIYASLEVPPNPAGPDLGTFPCCTAQYNASGGTNASDCMYKASNGGIGEVVRK